MYNLTATSKGEEIELSYWDSPEPKHWYEPKKTVMVHPAYRYEFSRFLFDYCIKINKHYVVEIQTGINCDSLASRVEIKEGDYLLSDPPIKTYYAILKPVVDVIEEKQMSPNEYLLNEFGNWCIINSIQLKDSNQVCETVTKFLKRNK